MLYSARTRGFYTHEMTYGGGIPDDAIKITDDEYCALIAGQESGKLIFPGDDGFPALFDPPKKTTDEVWKEIKAERDRRTMNGGYPVGDKWFHSDLVSRTQQLGLVLLGANVPADLEWKILGGATATMTQELAGQILAAAAASDIAVFAAAEAHKAAMEASPDPAAYDFSAGWPKAFGE